ncbi:MAG: efflux RND transporter permease subunit [Candidatus Hydrogenedentes bacterium]|nr:efflux RND transporter permease subunit [Candidatus Hydrogenedentota bacterium]
MKFSLPEMAMRRPVTVIMLLLSMLGLGGIALKKIPIEFIPRMDFPFIGCAIPYPGATPEQVENEIAIPAEGEFRTLSHLKRITTMSDSSGCSVNLNFTGDADMTLATSEVRDRMERLKGKLPANVDRLYLRRFSSTSMPVMMFTMVWEGDEQELTHLTRTIFQPRLMRLEGVADAQIYGKEESQVLVEFDQDALRTHNLALYQVVTALQSSSLNVSVGGLTQNNTKYYVRALDEFSTPEQIGDLVIGPHALRLKEVAKVSYRSRDIMHDYAFDGKHGVFVIVRKESEANTTEVCRAIKEQIEEIKKDSAFRGIDVFVFFDQGKLILSALNGLLSAGKEGALLAIFVLFLFLRRIRPTIIIALCIPASVVVALVYMYFVGMTLNLITMISLIIAFGLLVDDAIVVIENIYRHQQLGDSPRDSAQRGAREVGIAITASTATTIVVFLPMFYMQTGDMAVYMRQFAAPMTVSLAASLLIAVTLIPLAMSRMRTRQQLLSGKLAQRILSVGGGTGGSRLAGVLSWLSNMGIETRIINFYVHALRWTLKNRLATMALIVCALVVTYLVPFKQLGMQDMPTADTHSVNIEVIFDQDFDMKMAGETFDKIEKAIDTQRSELGIKNIFLDYSPEGGQVRVYLRAVDEYPSGQEPPYSTEQVRDILWQRLPTQLPGAELQFSVAESSEGQTRSVSLRMRGDDTEVLTAYAERFKALMHEAMPELSDIKTDTKRDKEEIQVRIDEALADRARVTPMNIAQTVDFALNGVRLPYIKRAGREIPVWAQFREEDRKTRANLDNVLVVSPTGTLLPLDQLVSLSKAASPKSITRVDSQNVITITAQVRSTEDIGRISEKLQRLSRAFELPLGYRIDLGDEFADLAGNMANFVTALFMALILIYIVMAALFESYVLPLSILSSVMLSFLGVAWAMYLTHTAMDTVAMIGIILLAGIVVKNGIVIIDHLNQLRKGGMDRFEATLQAGRDRYRPVMMTALATMLGCVPLALGGGNGDYSDSRGSAIALHNDRRSAPVVLALLRRFGGSSRPPAGETGGKGAGDGGLRV